MMWTGFIFRILMEKAVIQVRIAGGFVVAMGTGSAHREMFFFSFGVLGLNSGPTP
jgi:hypothetical protein